MELFLRYLSQVKNNILNGRFYLTNKKLNKLSGKIIERTPARDRSGKPPETPLGINSAHSVTRELAMDSPVALRQAAKEIL
jgi:hypothetical protein